MARKCGCSMRSSGYFINTAMELKANWRGMVIMEVWRANDGDSMSYFDEGKLLYVGTGSQGSNSVSADCDKFKMTDQELIDKLTIFDRIFDITTNFCFNLFKLSK